jgi:hypothetical protein
MPFGSDYRSDDPAAAAAELGIAASNENAPTVLTIVPIARHCPVLVQVAPVPRSGRALPRDVLSSFGTWLHDAEVVHDGSSDGGRSSPAFVPFIHPSFSVDIGLARFCGRFALGNDRKNQSPGSPNEDMSP